MQSDGQYRHMIGDSRDRGVNGAGDKCLPLPAYVVLVLNATKMIGDGCDNDPGLWASLLCCMRFSAVIIVKNESNYY